MTERTLDSMISDYTKLRDEKTRINREAKDKIGQLDEVMATIESEIFSLLTQTGQESAKTKAGTAFKTTKDYVGVQEIEDFREFLAEQTTDNEDLRQLILNDFPWHFFTKAVSKDAVKAYMKENDGVAPVGIKYDKEIAISIRK